METLALSSGLAACCQSCGLAPSGSVTTTKLGETEEDACGASSRSARRNRSSVGTVLNVSLNVTSRKLLYSWSRPQDISKEGHRTQAAGSCPGQSVSFPVSFFKLEPGVQSLLSTVQLRGCQLRSHRWPCPQPGGKAILQEPWGQPESRARRPEGSLPGLSKGCFCEGTSSPLPPGEWELSVCHL